MKRFTCIFLSSSITIIAFLFGLAAQALQPESGASQLTNTCEIIEKLRDYESREDSIRSIPEELVFSSPDFDGRPVNLRVKDFGNNYVELLEERNIHTAGLFKFKIFNFALQNVFERKSKYMEILRINNSKRVKDSNYKLGYCLASNSSLRELWKQNDKISNLDYQPEKFVIFLQSSIETAVRAKLLMDRLKVLDYELSTNLKKYPAKTRYKKNSREQEAYDGPERTKIKEFYAPLISAVNAHLNVIRTDAPTILDIEHDVELSSLSLTRYILSLSDFSKAILDLFTKKQLQTVTEYVGNNISRDKVITALLSLENITSVENLVNEQLKNNNSALVREAQQAIGQALETINQSAAKVCKSDAENLHHFDELVYETLKTNLVIPQTRSTLFRDIGAYCYLNEKLPKQDRSFFNWRTMGGLGLLGAGSAMQWAGYLSFVGKAAFWAGEGLLLWDSYNNYMFYSSKLDHTNFVSQGGFLSYSDELELNSQVLAGGVETVIAPASFGLGALSYKPVVNYMPELKYKLSSNKQVRKHQVATTTSRMGLAHYNKRILKNARYADYRESIRNRYRFFQSNEEFQAKLFKARLLKDDYLSSKPFLGIKIKFAEPISAFHRNSPEGRKIITMLDDLSRPSPKSESWDSLDDLLVYFGDPKKPFDGPWDSLDDVLDKGFTADAQLPLLQQSLKKYSTRSFFDSKTRQDRIIKLELPVVKNGIKQDELVSHPFESYADMEAYTRRIKKQRNDAFATTPSEELARDSLIYEHLDDWAKKYRYLEFARNTLRTLNNPTAQHTNYLNKVDEVFLSPHSMPRGDSRLNLLKQEIRSERVDLFRTEKAKRSLLGEDYDNWQAATQVETTSPSIIGKGKTFVFGKLKEYSALWTTVIGFAVYKKFFAVGPAAVWRAEKEAVYRQISRMDFQGIDGFTSDEFQCAKSGRFFSFMLCYNELAAKEVEPIVLSIINLDRASWTNIRSPELDAESLNLLANNARIKEILRNYAYKMLRLRKMFRGGELFELSNRILEQSIDDFSKTEFAKIIDEQNPGFPELSTRILEVLSVPENIENREMVLDKLLMKLASDYNSIEDFEANFIELIKEYLDNKASVVASVTNKSRLTRSLENQLNGISYEEANKSAAEIDRLSEAERAFDISTGNIFGDTKPSDLDYEPEDKLRPAPQSKDEAKDRINEGL